MVDWTGEFLRIGVFVPQFLAALAALVLAAWLLWRDSENRTYRAFALYLFVRGSWIILRQLSLINQEIPGEVYTARGQYFLDVTNYFILAQVPAIAYFLLVYLRPVGRWETRISGAVILAGAIWIEYLFATDHCNLQCDTPAGETLGPLSLLFPGFRMALVLAALLLIHAAAAAGPGVFRRGTALLGVAFLVDGLVESTLSLTGFLVHGYEAATAGLVDSPIIPFVVFGTYLPIPFDLWAAWKFTTLRAEDPTVKPSPRTLWIAVALTPLPGVVFQIADALNSTHYTGSFVMGIFRFAIPVVAAYALVRHQLFEKPVETKFRSRAAMGFLAALVGASFFVASEFAYNLLVPKFGLLVGGVVLLIAIVFLHPLERFGRRLAEIAFPGEPSTATLGAKERHRLFREQMQVAWRDGSITRRERLLLNTLRERLGISIGDATNIEDDVVRRPPAFA